MACPTSARSLNQSRNEGYLIEGFCTGGGLKILDDGIRHDGSGWKGYLTTGFSTGAGMKTLDVGTKRDPSGCEGYLTWGFGTGCGMKFLVVGIRCNGSGWSWKIFSYQNFDSIKLSDWKELTWQTTFPISIMNPFLSARRYVALV